MTEVVCWNLKKKIFEHLNFNISVYFRHRNFLSEYFKGSLYKQGVPKPMSKTSPGYSPPLIKQKISYQHGSKSEQVPRYPLLCRNPRNAVINKKHATMSNA